MKASKVLGLFIIVLVISLSFSGSILSATQNNTEGNNNSSVDLNNTDLNNTNDTLINNSVIINLINSLKSNGPPGWDPLYPYWDFKTNFYVDGRKAPTDKDSMKIPDLLYGHNKATQELNKMYDNMVDNGNDVIRVADEYYNAHPTTAYDSGSGTRWAHVPRAVLFHCYQDNFLAFKSAHAGLTAYYNSMTPVMQAIGGGGGVAAVGGGIAIAVSLVSAYKAGMVILTPAVDASVAATEGGTAPAAIGVGAAIAAGTTSLTVLGLVSGSIGVIGGLICGAVSGVMGGHLSMLADIEPKLRTYEQMGLAVEAQTYLNASSINGNETNETNVIVTSIFNSEINDAKNETEKTSVEYMYQEQGYDVVGYLNQKTINTALNQSVENLTLNKTSNNTKKYVLDKPFVVKSDKFSFKNDVTKLPELKWTLDWDPWMKSSMAPKWSPPYKSWKWYQFWKPIANACYAVGFAIATVAFWIAFAISYVLYTIYWFGAMILVIPFINMGKIIDYSVKIEDAKSELEDMSVEQNYTFNKTPDKMYDIVKEYKNVTLEVPVNTTVTS